MEWSKWNGIEWNRTEGSGVEWHGAEPKGREQAVHGLQLKPQREKLYHASALRKQASFEKIKTILPNERSSAGSPFGQGQNMFLHIYQNDDKYLLLRMLSSTRDVSNPCTRGGSCLEYTTEKEKAKKNNSTNQSQFLHRLVNRQLETKHSQWMREKLAAVTSLPKGGKLLAYSHSLCFTKIDVSGSWCYSHLSVFFILNKIVFSLSAQCQNSRSERKLLSNNWPSSPLPDVR